MFTRFIIPGVPGVKQRPRFTKKTGRAYTPQQTINYENLVKMIYKGEFWDCLPMEMTIIALFPIPKSFSKKRIDQCLSGQMAPSVKDCDNIAKIIADGLNNIAYSDDKHINRLNVLKLYTQNPQEVGAYVEIKDFSMVNNTQSAISLYQQISSGGWC